MRLTLVLFIVGMMLLSAAVSVGLFLYQMGVFNDA